MWLEHIKNILSETNIDYLNADLPLAVFMIKLLYSRINFDNFTNFITFNDYVESSHSIELRYFIQYTIKVEIDQECLNKEKQIDDEIEKLDEMFQTISEEERRDQINPPGYGNPVGPSIKTPTYENRLILYDTFIKGRKGIKKQYADYWIQKEVSLERSKNPVCRISWMLPNYYNYFKTEINNKYYLYNKVGNNMRKTNIYRQLEKDILQILNKFNTEEDFMKLLKSIRDIKLMENPNPISPEI